MEETNRIPCDYCKKDIVIPQDTADIFMYAGFSENKVMLVLLCLSCGAINDLFYDFRESMADDYVTEKPPWKNEEGYKKTIREIEEMRKMKGITNA